MFLPFPFVRRSPYCTHLSTDQPRSARICVLAVPIQRVKMNFTTGVFNGAGFRIEIVPVPDFLEKNLFCGTNVDDLKERGDFAVCLQKPLLVEGGYSERTKLSTTT